MAFRGDRSPSTLRSTPETGNRVCAYCGGPVSGKQIRCSNSCRAAAARERHARKPNGAGPPRPRRFQCGEDIYGIIDRLRNLYDPYNGITPQEIICSLLEDEYESLWEKVCNG